MRGVDGHDHDRDHVDGAHVDVRESVGVRGRSWS